MDEKIVRIVSYPASGFEEGRAPAQIALTLGRKKLMPITGDDRIDVALKKVEEYLKEE